VAAIIRVLHKSAEIVTGLHINYVTRQQYKHKQLCLFLKQCKSLYLFVTLQQIITFPSARAVIKCETKVTGHKTTADLL
jgi:hypothetical protein